MTRLKVRFLGGFEVRAASGIPVRLPTRKAEALFAYLALSPGRSHPRDKLTALLWPENPDRQARQSLRQALFHLRGALRAVECEGALLDPAEGLALDPAAVEVDAAEFERLVREGTPAALERAHDLYEGDLLAGLVARSPGFEEWLMAERGRLAELALEGLARLVALTSQRGAVERAIQLAGRLLALDPLQEAVHRTLMRLYVRAGRREAALRQYQVCLDVLRRELGTEPEPETRQIYQELVRHPGSAPAPAHPIAPPAAPGWPLVGRALDLDRLRAARAEAWGGEGRLAVVLGEAGAGKTRLLEELAAEARRDGGRVLLGRAYEMERVLPFGTWVEALRGGLAAESGVVAELDPVGRPALQLLIPELGPPAGGTVTAGEVTVALFEAVTSVLTRLAARQPLLVVLEDLHWADEMSVRLLAFVIRRLAASPILVLVSAREEELVGAPILEQLLRDLEVGGKLSRLPLRRLTRAATADLVRALARRATRPTMARLVEQVWRASEGNPFMAVATLRAFEEAGGPRSRGRLPLPQRVRELVTGRLERLTPRGREVAAAAAVLGNDFGFEVLQRTAGLDERTTAEAIEELVRRRILNHAGGVFTFDHDQIRTVAYDRISAARRRVLHAAAGDALEAVHGGRLDLVSGHLAHHYARAGHAGKMVTYLGHFAETARRRGALVEALRALDEALAQLRRAPRGEAERPHLELALRRAQIVSIQGRFQEVFDALLPLREVAERIGDPVLTGHYHIRLAIGYANLARHAEAVDAANRAIEEARRSGDDVVLGRAHYVLAITGFSTGDPQGGVAHGRQAVALLERAGEPPWAGQAWWILGLNHFLLGEFDAALDAEERVFALAERHGDRMLEGFAAYSTAWIQATRGDVAAAMAAAERGMARAPDRANRVSAQGLLGYAHLEAGDGARAIALLEAVIPQTTGFDIRRSLFTLHLADAYLRSGEPARARDLAAGAVGVARGIGFRWGEAWGERLLGRIARESGDLPAAAAHLDAALAIFSGLAARFEVALTGLDRAALARARGDAAGAAERVQAAHRELVALGVPVYVSRAEALAERLGVRLGAAPG